MLYLEENTVKECVMWKCSVICSRAYPIMPESELKHRFYDLLVFPQQYVPLLDQPEIPSIICLTLKLIFILLDIFIFHSTVHVLLV